MLIKKLLLIGLLSLTACSQQKVEPVSTEAQVDVPEVVSVPEPAKPASSLPVVKDGVKANKIVVDKSDRTLILFDGQTEIARYANIRFGDAPNGHKQFEGDEKTPEGDYTIDGRNPGSSYHLSLRVSYPNAADTAFAQSKGKSAGGDIFIHGQPNGYTGPTIARDWTDGCIALSNAEIQQIWKLVPDGAKIKIQP